MVPGQTLCHSTSHTVTARRLSPAVLLLTCLASFKICRTNLHRFRQPTYPDVVRLGAYKFLRNQLLVRSQMLCTRRLAAEPGFPIGTLMSRIGTLIEIACVLSFSSFRCMSNHHVRVRASLKQYIRRSLVTPIINAGSCIQAAWISGTGSGSAAD